MEKINLSKSDRYVIAEFVYSNESDILIKSDATALVEVLHSHDILANPKAWIKDINANKHSVATRLTVLLDENIPDKQGQAIMDEYYGKAKYHH